MDDATKLKLKQAINENVHLYSARHNRDYLTIGIEIAPQFPELVQRVDWVDDEEPPNKYHADMVPVADVKAAMKFVPPPPEEVPQKKTE